MRPVPERLPYYRESRKQRVSQRHYLTNCRTREQQFADQVRCVCTISKGGIRHPAIIRMCSARPLVVTHWEKRALANTQKETRQESANKVVCDSGQDRDETPKGHANGEVHGRFSDVIEKH